MDTGDRGRYDRSHPRYVRDLTDEKWGEIAPQNPPTNRGDDKRTVGLRDVVKVIRYIPTCADHYHGKAVSDTAATRRSVLDGPGLSTAAFELLP